MTDPIAGPMDIDADDKSDDLDEQWGQADDPDALAPAEQDWVEENETGAESAS